MYLLESLICVPNTHVMDPQFRIHTVPEEESFRIHSVRFGVDCAFTNGLVRMCIGTSQKKNVALSSLLPHAPDSPLHIDIYSHHEVLIPLLPNVLNKLVRKFLYEVTVI